VKKLPVTLTVAAARDIREIARYIALDNPAAARRFEDEFWLALDRISVFPRTGYAIPGRPFPTMRGSQRFRRYAIVYQVVQEHEVDIVRVIHCARDISSLL